MKIPNKALTYILHQRTGYIDRDNYVFIRKLNKKLPTIIKDNSIHSFITMMNHKQIRSSFIQDMENEYLSIKPFLPKNCRSVLDIGCGVAGIDVFINSHYHDFPPTFYLLDKTKIEKNVYYGFKEKGAFYNSLEIAKNLLKKNGVSSSSIMPIEATDDNAINIDSEIDLAISLISWGFHYPVETYLNSVYSLLSKGGTIIIDIRKDTNGLEVFSRKFPNFAQVPIDRKYYRIHATKV